MRNGLTEDFWLRHLVDVENPLIHLIDPSTPLDLSVLTQSSRELGYELFSIEARHAQSVSALLDEFAQAMKFPSFFGRSWDALLDLTRDLSWLRARGYVLVISNADSLLLLPEREFSVFLRVLEATIREWRDERGEYQEREVATPFHVILSAGNALRARLLEECNEPVCDHKSVHSFRVVRTPGGVVSSECFRDAEKLIGAGAELDLVLSFLRERGLSEIQSIYTLAALLEKSVPYAKGIVAGSQTWSDRYEKDESIRKAARDALRDLGLL